MLARKLGVGRDLAEQHLIRDRVSLRLDTLLLQLIGYQGLELYHQLGLCCRIEIICDAVSELRWLKGEVEELVVSESKRLYPWWRTQAK